MLVLTRKTGDRIEIGPDIVLTVVRVSQGVVRLGIEAPASVNVRRSELPDRGHWHPGDVLTIAEPEAQP